MAWLPLPTRHTHQAMARGPVLPANSRPTLKQPQPQQAAIQDINNLHDNNTDDTHNSNPTQVFPHTWLRVTSRVLTPPTLPSRSRPHLLPNRKHRGSGMRKGTRSSPESSQRMSSSGYETRNILQTNFNEIEGMLD